MSTGVALGAAFARSAEIVVILNASLARFARAPRAFLPRLLAFLRS